MLLGCYTLIGSVQGTAWLSCVGIYVSQTPSPEVLFLTVISFINTTSSPGQVCCPYTPRERWREGERDLVKISF